MKFDLIEWSQWKALYRFAHIGNHERHSFTYSGEPEGGIVKSYGDSWYVWHREWGTRATYTRTPDEVYLIRKNDDGHEAIKMVLCKHGYDDYELGEDEYYLDDFEQDLDWRHRISDTEIEDDDSEENEESEGVDSDSAASIM